MFDDFWDRIFSEYGLLVMILIASNISLFVQNKLLTKTLISHGQKTVEILTKVESGFSNIKDTSTEIKSMLVSILNRPQGG